MIFSVKIVLAGVRKAAQCDPGPDLQVFRGHFSFGLDLFWKFGLRGPSSPFLSFPYPAISQVTPGWRLCCGGGRQTVLTELLSSAHLQRLAFSFSRAAKHFPRNLRF